VRESPTSSGQFVLSGCHNGDIKHLLLVDPEGRVSRHLFKLALIYLIYRISPSISREISDNFENAYLGVRPILGSRKMSSLTTRQATNMFANESSFVAADKFSEQ